MQHRKFFKKKKHNIVEKSDFSWHDKSIDQFGEMN